MSQALYWRPARSGKKRVGDGKLRELFRDRPRLLGTRDVEYLQGLADAGVAGAQELLDAIEKHEDIELSIES